MWLKYLVLVLLDLDKGIIRCGVKLTMVDLAVPGYFSKKMKQPMKIFMLLRIFLFVEFWIFKLIRVENLVLASDLLCKYDYIWANQMTCNFNFSFFIGCNKMHKLLGYHFYPMRSKHDSYWLIFFFMNICSLDLPDM